MRASLNIERLLTLSSRIRDQCKPPRFLLQAVMKYLTDRCPSWMKKPEIARTPNQPPNITRPSIYSGTTRYQAAPEDPIDPSFHPSIVAKPPPPPGPTPECPDLQKYRKNSHARPSRAVEPSRGCDVTILGGAVHQPHPLTYLVADLALPPPHWMEIPVNATSTSAESARQCTLNGFAA